MFDNEFAPYDILQEHEIMINQHTMNFDAVQNAVNNQAQQLDVLVELCKVQAKQLDALNTKIEKYEAKRNG